MKKNALYEQLETQYTKFRVRLQKAVVTGRFAAFSMFKQQQWLQRIQRCRIQLQRAGAGLAVVAVLAVGNEVQAQIPDCLYTPRTGMDNPIDTLLPGPRLYKSGTIVDMDNDGDNDVVLVASYYNVSTSGHDRGRMIYYKNSGTNAAPNLEPVYIPTGGPVPGPLGTIRDKENITFVDIDNDGDLDVFAGAEVGYGVYPAPGNSTSNLHYYENTTGDVFGYVERTGASNPLDTVGNFINSVLPTPALRSSRASFVDIDGDGDQDCFVTVKEVTYNNIWTTNNRQYKLMYYKNVGTATSPRFERQLGTNNPLHLVNTTLALDYYVDGELIFRDIDNDNDLDLYYVFTKTNRNLVGTGLQQGISLVNNGTATLPNFSVSTNTPVQDFYNNNAARDYRIIMVGDLKGTTDWDFVTSDYGVGGSPLIRFFENSGAIQVRQLPNSMPLTIYPNPSIGTIYWEEPLTGDVRIYSTLGQAVHSQTLHEAYQLELSKLPNGVYLLVLDAEGKRYRQLLKIQKK